METKEQLVNTIRKWIKIDNEIRALQKESNKRKVDKKKISSDLIEVMKKNEIDCFLIKNGKKMVAPKPKVSARDRDTFACVVVYRIYNYM